MTKCRSYCCWHFTFSASMFSARFRYFTRARKTN